MKSCDDDDDDATSGRKLIKDLMVEKELCCRTFGAEAVDNLMPVSDKVDEFYFSPVISFIISSGVALID